MTRRILRVRNRVRAGARAVLRRRGRQVPAEARRRHGRHAEHRERAIRSTSASRRASSPSSGIEIKKQVLQSGNDIVLALANNNGDIGYLGYVPMFIARTQGIKFVLISASEVEGTSARRQLAEHHGQGVELDPHAADLAGKTIAVNALKGVGEVMIKAALKKVGVDPNSPKLLALGFGAMRTALNNGQVDAFWAPEPFVSQGLNLDGDRIVMAPGPGARQVLADRGLRRARRLGLAEPAARQVVPRGDQRVARVRAVASGRGPRAASCRRRRTCGCRSGARSSTATSSCSSRSTRRSSA